MEGSRNWESLVVEIYRSKEVNRVGTLQKFMNVTEQLLCRMMIIINSK